VTKQPSIPGSVGVIDIGSNSIKLLVAIRDPDGSIKERANQTLEVRLGSGLSRNPPELEPESIERAIEAVLALLADAEGFGAERIRIVATSAVRDAANGRDFVERLNERSGRTTDVLSSLDEAHLIGRGVTCDPGLSGVSEFSLFDLGGGSLEMLAFRQGAVVHLASVPLGCVRLTERFFSDPTEAIPHQETAAIRQHVASALSESGFPFRQCAGTTAVVTGGTATTLRAIRAAAQ
jgi:exopolyphosphatase/guanosine-5'-triphosphate,3'-diphosphate pyrophosphatase